MKSSPVKYVESHTVSLNVFLILYIYIVCVLIVANISPVSAASYCIFFLLGLAGLCLLFVRAKYTITVRKDILEISIKFLIRIVFLRLTIAEVESLEEVSTGEVTSSFTIEKITPGSISYLIKLPRAVKLSMANKMNYIISTDRPDELVTLVTSINK